MPAVWPVVRRILRGENILVKAIHKSHASWLDRKSHLATTTTTSTNDRSFTGYDPFCRKVDVEGIGVDGYGYSVTITGGNADSQKKSKFRKMFSRKEYDDKSDLDSQVSVREPKRSRRGDR